MARYEGRHSVTHVHARQRAQADSSGYAARHLPTRAAHPGRSFVVGSTMAVVVAASGGALGQATGALALDGGADVTLDALAPAPASVAAALDTGTAMEALAGGTMTHVAAVADVALVGKTRQEAAAKVARDKARTDALAHAQADPKAAARVILPEFGFTSTAQWQCLDKLFTGESSWRWTATNASSGAYGIPQALPGSKMASFGADWRTNPVTQIRWGIDYIKKVYGSPCNAWNTWNARYPHWY